MLESHVHDAADDLEEIFEDVFFSVLIIVLNLSSKRKDELLLLILDILGGDGGALCTFKSLPLKIEFVIWAKKIKIHKKII